MTVDTRFIKKQKRREELLSEARQGRSPGSGSAEKDLDSAGLGIGRCTNSRFSFARNALLYDSYSAYEVVNSWPPERKGAVGCWDVCLWDKPTPNWDDLGYPGRG